MKINIPVFVEVKKLPDEFKLDSVWQHQELMQGTMVFDKDTNSFNVTSETGIPWFINCLHLSGDDLV